MPQVNDWDTVCKRWAEELQNYDADGGATYGLQYVIDDLVLAYGLAKVLQAATNWRRWQEAESRLSGAPTEAAT